MLISYSSSSRHIYVFILMRPCIKQSLRKMWAIQLDFQLFILCIYFLSSIPPCNNYPFFTRSVQLISILLQHHISKHSVHYCTLVKWSRYRPGVAQRVGRIIALLFHDRDTRRRCSGQKHAPAALYPRERPGTYFTGGWVGPRAGLEGRKISTHWDSIPDRPVHSQSLYRLSYPAHCYTGIYLIKDKKCNPVQHFPQHTSLVGKLV